MSSSITLSAATRQNLLSLQDTATLLSTTQNRLSTGKKVNSALDNPTNFFTSQSLSARSNDLSSLLDGISNGIQTIQAANQGITSITKLIDTAKSTAQQALADKTGGSSGIAGGSSAQSAKVTGTSKLSDLGTTANGVTTFDLSSPTKDASLDISLDGGTTHTTIRLDSNALASAGIDTTKVTGDQLLSAINTQIAASGALKGKVTASLSSDGRLGFSTTAAGGSARVTVAGSASSTIDLGYGKSATTPTAATVTAANALSASTDFSNGASASLTVSDGTKTVAITLNKDSKLADGVTALAPSGAGNTASRANIASAIQYQLSQAGSSVTVSVDSVSNKLVFTSGDTGPDAALSVTAGADSTVGGSTGATGIGFTSFSTSGSTSTAPTDLPISAFTAGSVVGSATTSTGAAGVQSFTKALNLASNNTITVGLDTTFTVGGKTITLNKDSQTVGGTALSARSYASDIASAINKQLQTGTPSTITAGVDAGGHLTFTDTNQANAAPAVTGIADYLGVLSSPSTTVFSAASFSTATFDLTGGKAAGFTVSDGTNTAAIVINANSPKSGQATLGTQSPSSVSASDVLDSINLQFAASGKPFKATIDQSGKLNITSAAAGAGALSISVATDTASTTSVFTSGNAPSAGSAGTAASQSTTTTAATATSTAANAAATLTANSFGTGGHTKFTVGGTTIDITGASLYDSTPGHTLSSDPTKLVQTINKALSDAGNTSITASLTGGKLVFTNSAGGNTAPALTTNGAGLTDQLGLFGTPATTTLTNALTGPLDLTGGKSATFSVAGGAAITLSATAATDGAGGTLGTSATLANVVKSINYQLGLQSSTSSAYINNAGKLAFVGPDSGTSPPTITNVTDTFGFGFGTAASTTAGGSVTAPGGTVDLSGGKSSKFTIGDGTNSATITINQNSTTDGTTLLGTSASTTDVAKAIQYQLDHAATPIKATAAFTGGKLTVTSKAVGSSATVTLGGINDAAQLGVGSTSAANGVFSLGTGAAATGLSATGSEATDGSSKASVVGTAQAGTKDFSGTKDASFTLKLGDGATKVITLNNATFSSSTTVSQDAIAKAINDQITADTGLAGKVSASYVNNKLVLSTTTSGSDQKLTVQAQQVTSGGTTALDIGLGGVGATAQSSQGTDVGGSKGTSSVRSALAAQFNTILQQISQQAQDASYNGVNLLFRTSTNASDNTLHLAFNEKNTSGLDIKGVKFDAVGLGLNNVTGDFQADTDINAAINALNTATSTLRTQSSTFGANLSVVQNRQDFTKQLSTILDTGSSNLTSADLNEEAANSQALSTRNSLAISALSLANQAQQGILQLLR